MSGDFQSPVNCVEQQQYYQVERQTRIGLAKLRQVGDECKDSSDHPVEQEKGPQHKQLFVLVVEEILLHRSELGLH